MSRPLDCISVLNSIRFKEATRDSWNVFFWNLSFTFSRLCTSQMTLNFQPCKMTEMQRSLVWNLKEISRKPPDSTRLHSEYCFYNPRPQRRKLGRFSNSRFENSPIWNMRAAVMKVLSDLNSYSLKAAHRINGVCHSECCLSNGKDSASPKVTECSQPHTFLVKVITSLKFTSTATFQFCQWMQI